MSTTSPNLHADPSVAKAAGWMAAWLTLMLGMTLASREATKVIHPLLLMELRSVFGFIMLLPLVFAAGGFAAMKTNRLGLHVARNVAHYVGQSLWLVALGMITLAQLISIEFSSPLWTAILAYFFLGEIMNARKIAAILLGLVGVFIIVRPDSGGLDTGHLVVLGAAVAFAISVVMVKSLTRTETALAISFWMLIIQSVIGLIPAATHWTMPPLATWPWILLAAFCGSFAHYCMARALAHADAMVVVPMDFLRVPLTALLGYLVYGELIDHATAIGAGLILAGNLLNLQKKKPVDPKT